MAHFSGDYPEVLRGVLRERADELGIPPELIGIHTPEAAHLSRPTLDETLDRIDAATGCQQCGNPLGPSPSDDFCG